MLVPCTVAPALLSGIALAMHCSSRTVPHPLLSPPNPTIWKPRPTNARSPLPHQHLLLLGSLLVPRPPIQPSSSRHPAVPLSPPSPPSSLLTHLLLLLLLGGLLLLLGLCLLGDLSSEVVAARQKVIGAAAGTSASDRVTCSDQNPKDVASGKVSAQGTFGATSGWVVSGKMASPELSSSRMGASGRVTCSALHPREVATGGSEVSGNEGIRQSGEEHGAPCTPLQRHR